MECTFHSDWKKAVSSPRFFHRLEMSMTFKPFTQLSAKLHFLSWLSLMLNCKYWKTPVYFSQPSGRYVCLFYAYVSFLLYRFLQKTKVQICVLFAFYADWFINLKIFVVEKKEKKLRRMSFIAVWICKVWMSKWTQYKKAKYWILVITNYLHLIKTM